MFLMSITECKNHINFLPCIVQFDWLISDQLQYSLNIYQFACSALHFPIKNISNRSTKSTPCYIFHFDICRKSRRQLFFNQTSLLRLSLIVVSHIVKIRKFEMLYFQNRRHYRAENLTKIHFSVPYNLVYIRIQRASLY